MRYFTFVLMPQLLVQRAYMQPIYVEDSLLMLLIFIIYTTLIILDYEIHTTWLYTKKKKKPLYIKFTTVDLKLFH